jgi:recombination protein RecT
MNATAKEVDPIVLLAQVLRSDNFQSALADQLKGTAVTPQKFTATTIAAVRQNLKLLNVDRNSLYNAINKAASEGLLPDGNDGVINVYSTKVNGNYVDKAQWQRMVGGLIKMFARAEINAYVVSVYQNDKVEVWNDGDGQHIRHEPVVFGVRGDRIGALAVAKMPNGSVRFEAMNVEDLRKASAASKSKDKEGNPTGPWATWPERMEQKSCLHRLSRRVAILDPIAEAALRKINDEFEDDDDAPPAAPSVSVAATRPTALVAALEHEPAQSQPVPGAKVVQTPETAAAVVGAQESGDDSEGII